MAWNKEKLWKELDSKSLRKGVIEAAKIQPKLAGINILDLLKKNEITEYQRHNGMLLLLKLVLLVKAELDCDRYLEILTLNIQSGDQETKDISAYCIINFVLWAQAYISLSKYKNKTEYYIGLVAENSHTIFNEYQSTITYILEKNRFSVASNKETL